MTDVHSRAIRSKNMAAIRHKDTTPETGLRRALYKLGLRYRIHAGNVPGKPDIYFHRYKAAIFVHGCFWHMHACPQFKMPASRTRFWQKKLGENKRRDANHRHTLLTSGFRVCIVWGCALPRGAPQAACTQVAVVIAHWLRHTREELLEIPGLPAHVAD